MRKERGKAKHDINWHQLCAITSMPSLGSRLGDLSLVRAVLPGAISLALPKEIALDSWLSSLNMQVSKAHEKPYFISQRTQSILKCLRTLGHTLCQASLSTDLISRLRLGRGWFPVIPYSWLPPPVHSLHLTEPLQQFSF